jgi:hypothetical protein
MNSEIEPLCEISLLWREWELDGAMLHGRQSGRQKKDPISQRGKLGIL